MSVQSEKKEGIVVSETVLVSMFHFGHETISLWAKLEVIFALCKLDNCEVDPK